MRYYLFYEYRFLQPSVSKPVINKYIFLLNLTKGNIILEEFCNKWRQRRKLSAHFRTEAANTFRLNIISQKKVIIRTFSKSIGKS